MSRMASMSRWKASCAPTASSTRRGSNSISPSVAWRLRL
jgi:hypothetical protein